jgi:TP53 regulating kinase and related kinases
MTTTTTTTTKIASTSEKHNTNSGHDENNDTNPFLYQPQHWVLLSQGAEGRIWKIPSSVDRRVVPTVTVTSIDHHPSKNDDDDKDDNRSMNITTTTDHCSSKIRMMIAKERFSKRYRHPILDDKLTKQRSKMEARILQKCYNYYHHQNNNSTKCTNGNTGTDNYDDVSVERIDVPQVYHVDTTHATLFLEYIQGITIRDYLLQQKKSQQEQERPDEVLQSDPNDVKSTNGNDNPNPTDSSTRSHYDVWADIAMSMGETIHRLHYHLHIIHGDLTTANMMLRHTSLQRYYDDIENHTHQQQQNLPPKWDEKNLSHTIKNDVVVPVTDTGHVHHHRIMITLIDFGLAKNSESAEERAVDLYVLERALHSTHPELMMEENDDDDSDDNDENNHNNEGDNVDDENHENSGRSGNTKEDIDPTPMKLSPPNTFWQSFLIGYTRIVPPFPSTTTTTTTTIMKNHGEEVQCQPINDGENDVIMEEDDIKPMHNPKDGDEKGDDICENIDKDEIMKNDNDDDYNKNDIDMRRKSKRMKKQLQKMNNPNKKKTNHDIADAIRATMTRLEQVRQRGRKRECFG